MDSCVDLTWACIYACQRQYAQMPWVPEGSLHLAICDACFWSMCDPAPFYPSDSCPPNGADSHFFWGSIMYGYLIYDTLFTLMFYSAVGSLAFLLHHCLGLICCCFGLYFNRLALFGTAIEVFFEGTTPLLHVMGCLKVVGWEGTPSYTALGGAPLHSQPCAQRC